MSAGASRRGRDRRRADHLGSGRAQGAYRLREGRSGRDDVVEHDHPDAGRGRDLMTPATLRRAPRRRAPVGRRTHGRCAAVARCAAPRDGRRGRRRGTRGGAVGGARRGHRHEHDIPARRREDGCRRFGHGRGQGAARSRARPVRPSSLRARITRAGLPRRPGRSIPAPRPDAAPLARERRGTALAQGDVGVVAAGARGRQEEGERIGECFAHRPDRPTRITHPGTVPRTDASRSGIRSACAQRPRLPRLGRRRYCGEPCCVARIVIPLSVRCQFAPRLT